jgi:hypothetical protein
VVFVLALHSPNSSYDGEDCCHTHLREDAAAHEATAAAQHLRIFRARQTKVVAKMQEEINFNKKCESATMTWKIPRGRLEAENVVLKSTCLNVCENEAYLRLQVGRGGVVRIGLCVETPHWTPVRVQMCRITICSTSERWLESGHGWQEKACFEIGFGGKPASMKKLLDGSGDVAVTGPLEGSLKVLIPNDDEDEDWVEDYDDEDVEVSQEHLADLATGGELTIQAVFNLEKMTSVSVGCR